MKTNWIVIAALAAAPAAASEMQPVPSHVELGAYIVRTRGCHDCHTPWKLGPKGPEPDMTRALTGHPQDLVLPPAPKLEGPWTWVGAATNTAYSGPWGTSFAANLTPDLETGLGKWSFETFKQAVRTGRHEGQGRPILPPMPYHMLAAATDEDLAALWAYLRSLAPVHNKVPQPREPAE